jgi:hypothetical protein
LHFISPSHFSKDVLKGKNQMIKKIISKNPLFAAITLFIAIFTFIQLIRPSFLYSPDGSIRQFGVGYRKKTILPVWLLSIILGILSYTMVLGIVHSSQLMN